MKNLLNSNLKRLAILFLGLTLSLSSTGATVFADSSMEGEPTLNEQGILNDEQIEPTEDVLNKDDFDLNEEGAIFSTDDIEEHLTPIDDEIDPNVSNVSVEDSYSESSDEPMELPDSILIESVEETSIKNDVNQDQNEADQTVDFVITEHVTTGESQKSAYAVTTLSHDEEGFDCVTHEWSEWETDEESTCGEQGFQSRFCLNCGVDEYKDLPLAEHEWSEWTTDEWSTCIEHGSQSRWCQECGKEEYRELPLGKHDWSSWETTRKATIYKSGRKERTCINCDKKQKKTIAKKVLTKNQKKSAKVVNSYLKAAKKYNLKKMNTFFAKKGKKYGYPTVKLDWIFKKHNKKIKWKITDVSGKGKTITVKAKVTRPTIYKWTYNSFYSSLEHAYYNYETGEMAGEKAIQSINAKVKKGKMKTKTEIVSFKVVKTKKGWKIKSKTRTMVDIATAYFFKGMDNACDEFVDNYS